MKIFVTAHPGSGRNEIRAIDSSHYEIHVTALAQKNLANQAIIEIISDYFHVAKSLVTIKRGSFTKKKVVEIDVNLSLNI